MALLVILLCSTGIFPRFPSVSPDGKWIVVSVNGDLWKIPVDGGTGRCLTRSNGYDAEAIWSPDGRWIAFQSDRYGNGDIFLMDAEGKNPPTRLTYHSAWDTPLFFSEDGEWVYFYSRRLRYRGEVYRVNVHGGTPVLAIDFDIPYAYHIPDTNLILLMRGGEPWWRRHYRGGCSYDIFKMTLPDGRAERLTRFEGRDGWPLYSPVTERIYFVSNRDKDRINNLYSMDLNGNHIKKLTSFKEDIRFPSISRNGRVIAFLVMNNLYTYDVESGKIKKIEFSIPMDYRKQPDTYVRWAKNATDFALSPDEKELAFVLHGDIYVMRLKDGEPDRVVRVTSTPEPEKDVSWHPEKEMLVFSSLRDGDWDIFTAEPTKKKKFYNDVMFKIKKVFDTPETERKPEFSPDGKKIAFLKSTGFLYVVDADGKNQRQLSKENDCIWLDWSPDSRWIAYSRTALGWREDVFVVRANGSKGPINISNHPNDDYKPMWSSDGRRLSFASRDPEGNLWIKFVFLRKEDEDKGMEFWEEHQDSIKPLKKIEIDFKDIDERIHTVAKFEGEYNYFTASKDGRLYAIQAFDLSGNDVWSVEWTGKNLKRLSEGGADPEKILISNDNKKVYYLDGDGKLYVADVDKERSKPLSFHVGFILDKRSERKAAFLQAWWVLQDGFYDPHFHGIDWRGAYEKYLPYLDIVRNTEDFHTIVRMMIGELNASHLGIWKDEGGGEITGCLGIVPDYSYPGEGLRVKRIIKDSPSDMENGIKPGDVILAVNGERVTGETNFYSLLRMKRGKKIRITVKRGRKKEDIDIEPVSPWKIRNLIYKEWVFSNRKTVEEKSKGRLAYIHIRAMGSEDLKRFKKELYEFRDRKGLVLDIRYNGGGSIHDELLNILKRTVYAYSMERDGEKEYNSLFRWNKPIVLLINGYCYSDAEIFPAGFKELKLGTVVGTPTFGAVIGTNNLELVDGSTFRCPNEGWYRIEGVNMENNPVHPDIYIENPPEYDNRSDDPQLLKAIEILMNQIER